MLYLIGKVVTTHGIKGEVKVLPSTDFDRFLINKVVYIDNLPYTIEKVRVQNKYLLVGFKDFDNINLVLNLKGKEIYTNEDPLLETDEYHLPKLIDKDVYLMDGKLIGKVLEVLLYPQGYYLRVLTLDDKKVLIPFIDAFIKKVDEKGIWIDPIEGLL